MGSILGQETKIPHDAGQLSPCAAVRSLSTTTKNQCSQKATTKKVLNKSWRGMFSKWGEVGSGYNHSPAETTSGSAGDKGLDTFALHFLHIFYLIGQDNVIFQASVPLDFSLQRKLTPALQGLPGNMKMGKGLVFRWNLFYFAGLDLLCCHLIWQGLLSAILNTLLIGNMLQHIGSQVVKSPRFQCRRQEFNPWLVN